MWIVERENGEYESFFDLENALWEMVRLRNNHIKFIVYWMEVQP